MVPFFIYTGIILTLPFFFSSPKTTVILLDGNHTVQGVNVTTEAGVVELDKPYTQTTLSAPNLKPQSPSDVDEQQIQNQYAQTLRALPPKPVSVLFYFEEGSTRLTPESQMQTASLIDLIQTRQPCVVDIIGHTDTEGSAELNYELALKRAGMVKSFLEERQVQMTEVSVHSHGESDQLIPTADGVAEPRNRRVEVSVR